MQWDIVSCDIFHFKVCLNPLKQIQYQLHSSKVGSLMHICKCQLKCEKMKLGRTQVKTRHFLKIDFFFRANAEII